MTIKDLSARTGYSVGTVSRVLNDQPNVSEKARKAILDAARECGFQLNTNAQQLKKQHTNSILVVVKGISNQLFFSMVEAMQARIARTGHPLIVDYMDEESNEVLHALRLCREKKPLGVIFLGGNRAHFEADFDKECDFTVALLASPELRLSRLTLRDNRTPEALKARMNAAPSDEFYSSRATVTVINDGDADKLLSAAQDIFNKTK